MNLLGNFDFGTNNCSLNYFEHFLPPRIQDYSGYGGSKTFFRFTKMVQEAVHSKHTSCVPSVRPMCAKCAILLEMLHMFKIS